MFARKIEQRVRTNQSSHSHFYAQIVVPVHDGANAGRKTIDSLCETYRLDALFLMSRFYREGKNRLNSPRIRQPVPLPSFVEFLALDFGPQFAGMLLGNSSLPYGMKSSKC